MPAERYFQPIVPTKDSWQALLGDYDGSTRRFETLFRHLRNGGPAPTGASLVRHPIAQHERDNLHFLRADLDDLVTAPARAIRCFNMLMYFDRAFRARASRTATSPTCRRTCRPPRCGPARRTFQAGWTRNSPPGPAGQAPGLALPMTAVLLSQGSSGLGHPI
jgi:hypothetical protein